MYMFVYIIIYNKSNSIHNKNLHLRNLNLSPAISHLAGHLAMTPPPAGAASKALSVVAACLWSGPIDEDASTSATAELELNRATRTIEVGCSTRSRGKCPEMSSSVPLPTIVSMW